MTCAIDSGLRRIILLLLVLVVPAGCVTVTDSRFTREADRDEAVANYVELGKAYLDKGNLERARKHLNRALDLNPDDSAANAAKAIIYQTEGDDELAEESFRTAISNDPSYTQARMYYGSFLFVRNRFDEAREQFRRASEDTAFDKRAAAFYNLGTTQERLGNPAEAAQAYRRAVELSRGNAEALLALSRNLVETGDYSAASRYYSRLLNVMQRDARLTHSPQSLLTGIRIARYFGEHDRESSYALLLKNEFPDSLEYQQYKVMTTNDQ